MKGAAGLGGASQRRGLESHWRGGAGCSWPEGVGHEMRAESRSTVARPALGGLLAFRTATRLCTCVCTPEALAIVCTSESPRRCEKRSSHKTGDKGGRCPPTSSSGNKQEDGA